MKDQKRRRKCLQNRLTSVSDEESDMDDYKEDLKRIAHMISDSEDKSFDETKAKKELEKLTEIQKFRKNATM